MKRHAVPVVVRVKPHKACQHLALFVAEAARLSRHANKCLVPHLLSTNKARREQSARHDHHRCWSPCPPCYLHRRADCSYTCFPRSFTTFQRSTFFSLFSSATTQLMQTLLMCVLRRQGGGASKVSEVLGCRDDQASSSCVGRSGGRNSVWSKVPGIRNRQSALSGVEGWVIFREKKHDTRTFIHQRSPIL